MKYLTFLLSAAVLSGCSVSKNLDGDWVPVKQEIGGKALPASFFEKQMLTISDTTYTMHAESVDKGMVRYKDDKMDIYGREGVNTGKHFTAIYKLENGELKICYNLAGDSYPESFDTSGKPLYFLSVFKKK
ncbi:MAG: TIGR03067 domain-containing protein [Bacteroidota bacterium]